MSMAAIRTGACSTSMTRAARRRRILGVADRGADEDELIAAEAGHGVGGAHHGRQSARDFLQKLIAGAVPQGIVDELEAVKIANQQRKRALVAVRMRDGLLQPIVQQDAIRQARQGIVGGQMPQLLIRRLQSARARRDHLFEAQHMVAAPACRFPTCGTAPWRIAEPRSVRRVCATPATCRSGRAAAPPRSSRSRYGPNR